MPSSIQASDVALLPVAKKQAAITAMFDRISRRYDLLNHLLSLGIDHLWRRRAIAALRDLRPRAVLDVATGTGDLAIAASALEGVRVFGIDLSIGMLRIGQGKLIRRRLLGRAALLPADSAALPFSDGAFDAVICAYGARNFADLDRGLREMRRVLRPSGRLALLEFSKPRGAPLRQIYALYFSHVLPHIGRAISGDAAAYTYLPESVAAFPEGAKFCERLVAAGFSDARAQPLTFGITTLYTAQAMPPEVPNQK